MCQKDELDQQTAYEAPICWSEYVTEMKGTIFLRTLEGGKGVMALGGLPPILDNISLKLGVFPLVQLKKGPPLKYSRERPSTYRFALFPNPIILGENKS